MAERGRSTFLPMLLLIGGAVIVVLALFVVLVPVKQCWMCKTAGEFEVFRSKQGSFDLVTCPPCAGRGRYTLLQVWKGGIPDHPPPPGSEYDWTPQ